MFSRFIRYITIIAAIAVATLVVLNRNNFSSWIPAEYLEKIDIHRLFDKAQTQEEEEISTVDDNEEIMEQSDSLQIGTESDPAKIEVDSLGVDSLSVDSLQIN